MSKPDKKTKSLFAIATLMNPSTGQIPDSVNVSIQGVEYPVAVTLCVGKAERLLAGELVTTRKWARVVLTSSAASLVPMVTQTADDPVGDRTEALP